MLSIDIGRHNLGYTYFELSDNVIANIEFGIYDIDESTSNNVVIHRCKRLSEFFDMCLDKYGKIDFITIERQVQTNTIAMELMYAITSIALGITDNVTIFDPASKFTSIGLPYSVKNKSHKKLSIEMAETFLSSNFSDSVRLFNSHQKRDDIADSLNQGIVNMIKKRMIKMTLIEYKHIIVNSDRGNASELF